MDFKDPQIQKAIIIGILVVIVGYVFFFSSFLPFFFQPNKARIESLTSDYEKMSAELEKARQTVGNLAMLEAEYNRLHHKWVAAQGLLPRDKEVARLLRKVTRAGNQAGLSFTLFEPQSPVPREFITENPVKIIVHGQYHQLGIFLSKVSNLDRIVNVTKLHITKTDDKKRKKNDKVGRHDTIEAEMVISAYTLLEGGEVTDEKAAKGS